MSDFHNNNRSGIRTLDDRMELLESIVLGEPGKDGLAHHVKKNTDLIMAHSKACDERWASIQKWLMGILGSIITSGIVGLMIHFMSK